MGEGFRVSGLLRVRVGGLGCRVQGFRVSGLQGVSQSFRVELTPTFNSKTRRLLPNPTPENPMPTP